MDTLKILLLIDLRKFMDNILALAYLGDSVYELYIREYLLKQGISKVNNLQKKAIQFVSAKAQCAFVTEMIKSNFLKEEEMAIFNRGRNHKSHNSPKNTDIITYKYATGLEAVVGYLYLQGQKERIDDIMKFIIERGSLCISTEKM